MCGCSMTSCGESTGAAGRRAALSVLSASSADAKLVLSHSVSMGRSSSQC